MRGDVRSSTTVGSGELDVVSLADVRLGGNDLVLAHAQAGLRAEGSSGGARGEEEGETGGKNGEVLHSCFW